MKKRLLHCVVVGLLGAVPTLALLWLGATIPARADPNIHCVNESGSGCGGDCGGCYSSVQAAVDAASAGNEIRIAGGTYNPGGTVAIITKELVIRGGYDPTCNAHDPDPYQTVLDAQWGGSVVSITNAGDVFLQHLTLTHGNGTGNCGIWKGCGGGIYAKDTAVHIGHCVITDNVGSVSTSGSGGGIHIDNRSSSASADIWENDILSNTASTAGVGWGGGLYLEAGNFINPAIVTSNKFEGNTASTASDGQGGGLFLWQYATLSNNLFQHNYGSKAAGGGGYGGGLYLWEVWGATLEANRFLNNTALESGSYGYGGAIYGSARVVFTMTNNLLAENHASSAGGGLWLDTWDPSYLIAGTLVNNTLADNDAGAGSEGIWVGRYISLTLTNNIIAGHTVGITNTYPASATITADTNLFWNTTDPITGDNPILEDPLLTSDYHLGTGSPAVDAGLDIPWLTVDLEGNPRPPGEYDIGAFEGARWEVFLPLVVRNL